MHLKFIVLGLALGVAFVASGCATVFKGQKEDIVVITEPPGAEVLLDGQKRCKTPCTIPDVSTKKSHQIKVIKPGYQSLQAYMNRKVGWVWLIPDLFFGSWIAIGIDAITESWYTFDPNPMRIKLAPEGSGGGSFVLKPPSSLDLREDKGMSLLGGFFIAPTIGGGLSGSLGLYISPELILEFGIDISAGLFGPFFFASVESEGNARFKAFLGNSLYAAAGVGIQQTQGEMNLQSNNFAIDESPNVELQDIGLSFGIGNQWQFETFTIGVEWVSLFVPLSTQSLTINDASGNIESDAALRKEVEDTLDDPFRMSLRFLHLQMGVSF